MTIPIPASSGRSWFYGKEILISENPNTDRTYIGRKKGDAVELP